MKNTFQILFAGALLAGCVSSAPELKCNQDAPKCNQAEKKEACRESCKKDCPVGRWAFVENNWWMGIYRSPAGEYSAKVLFGGGSPLVQETVKKENGKLVLGGYRARESAAAYGRPFKAGAPDKQRHDRLEVSVSGDIATVVASVTDGNGKEIGKARTFTAKRIPALPKAPNLKALKYAKEIDLFAGGMDSWQAMGDAKRRHFGWTFKDGVLSNRIARKPDGTPKHGDLNIRTRRADFTDFKLAYDVRVPAGCNSGVYLRGIYELQVLDSYGKNVDPHNMAALYGRITPRVAAEKPAGEWQHVEAILCDRHLTVTLNDVNIIDNAPIEGVTGGAITSDEFKPGPIYLQGDHSDADFRNMILTPIVK